MPPIPVYVRPFERMALHAQSYGVLADNSTNNATALQAAIDAAAGNVSAFGSPVAINLPAGRIRVASTIRLKSHVYLKGQGGLLNGGGTRIIWTGSSSSPVFDSDSNNYLSNCVVEDIAIEPSSGSIPPDAGTGDGFRLYGVTNNCTFRRINIARLTGDGFDIRPQDLAPSDETAAGNVVFEQVFVSTCGGYGIRTDGYNQFTATMCDFNGNRGGAYYLANGISNQACCTIVGQWIESGGNAPSSDPIVLDNMSNQVVVFVGMTVSGPESASDVITITGATSSRPVLIGCNGFGYDNWINDTVNSESIPFSANITYFGTVTQMRQAVVRGTAPIMDMHDLDGTSDSRYFRQQIATGEWQLLSRNDDVSAKNTIIKAGAGNTLGFFGVDAVSRPTALTAANAGTINSGDATTDTVIGNMRTRIGELETKLQALGLLA